MDDGTRRLAILTLVMALIALGIYAFQEHTGDGRPVIIDNRRQLRQRNAQPAVTPHHVEVLPTEAEPQPVSQEQAEATTASILMPAAEEEFIGAVQQGQAAFRAAPNEMAKGGTRFQRRLAICRTLPGIAVSDWVGQIAQLESNSDGKGVLQISLAPDIRVETWNNDLSDIGSNTLIDPSTPLFATLTRMTVGTKVLFSGSFIPSDVDCVEEHSLSLSGAMTDPEFVFRFAAVSSIR